jgi:hypothetical protein
MSIRLRLWRLAGVLHRYWVESEAHVGKCRAHGFALRESGCVVHFATELRLHEGGVSDGKAGKEVLYFSGN